MDENENLILIGANCIDEWQMWRVLAWQMSNVVVFGGRKQFPDSRLSILAVSSVRAGAGEWRVVTGISRVSRARYRGLRRADTRRRENQTTVRMWGRDYIE